MSDSGMLIAAQEISASDMKSIGEELGAVSYSQESGEFQLSDGEGAVWVARQPSEFFIRAYEEEALNEWRRNLGANPVRAIEIQLGSGKSSYALFRDVACAFARKWNVVLVDVDGGILDRAVINGHEKGSSLV